VTETIDRSGVLQELDVILGRIAELEIRLRERIDECAELTEQVRCLEAERKIRDEYITSIEDAVIRLPMTERQLLETDNAYKELDALFSSYRIVTEGRLAEQARQIEAYRSRRVVRAADGVAVRLRRFSLAVRTASFLRCLLAHRPSRH
jgi:uncharacterized protein (DUF3084 family)